MADKKSGKLSEDADSQAAEGDASMFHWCSMIWSSEEVTAFFKAFWTGQKDPIPEELLCLNHCITCIEEYHRDRKMMVESGGSKQTEGVLFTFECSLLSHFLTSQKRRLQIRWQRKKLATGDKVAAKREADDHQLPIVLQHILKYPFYLFLKDLHDLFVEVLEDCLSQDEVGTVSQMPGLYLLLIHPNNQLHTWAKKALERFAPIQLDDSSDLLRVVNLILSVLKFDLQSDPILCNSIGLEEPSRRILVMSHQFSMVVYWEGLHTLLTHMDKNLMGNVHGEIPLTILNSLLHAAKSSSPDNHHFLEKLLCFRVLLESFTQEIWFRVAPHKQEDIFMKIFKCKVWLRLIESMGRSPQAQRTLSDHFWWVHHWASSLLGGTEKTDTHIRHSCVYVYHVLQHVRHQLVHFELKNNCRGLERCPFREGERTLNRMSFMKPEKQHIRAVPNLLNLAKVWCFLDERVSRKAPLSKSLYIGHAGFLTYETILEKVYVKMKAPAPDSRGLPSTGRHVFARRPPSVSHHSRTTSRSHNETMGSQQRSEKHDTSHTGSKSGEYRTGYTSNRDNEQGRGKSSKEKDGKSQVKGSNDTDRRRDRNSKDRRESSNHKDVAKSSKSSEQRLDRNLSLSVAHGYTHHRPFERTPTDSAERNRNQETSQSHRRSDSKGPRRLEERESTSNANQSDLNQEKHGARHSRALPHLSRNDRMTAGKVSKTRNISEGSSSGHESDSFYSAEGEKVFSFSELHGMLQTNHTSRRKTSEHVERHKSRSVSGEAGPLSESSTEGSTSSTVAVSFGTIQRKKRARLRNTVMLDRNGRIHPKDTTRLRLRECSILLDRISFSEDDRGETDIREARPGNQSPPRKKMRRILSSSDCSESEMDRDVACTATQGFNEAESSDIAEMSTEDVSDEEFPDQTANIPCLGIVRQDRGSGEVESSRDVASTSRESGRGAEMNLLDGSIDRGNNLHQESTDSRLKERASASETDHGGSAVGPENRGNDSSMEQRSQTGTLTPNAGHSEEGNHTDNVRGADGDRICHQTGDIDNDKNMLDRPTMPLVEVRVDASKANQEKPGVGLGDEEGDQQRSEKVSLAIVEKGEEATTESGHRSGEDSDDDILEVRVIEPVIETHEISSDEDEESEKTSKGPLTAVTLPVKEAESKGDATGPGLRDTSTIREQNKSKESSQGHLTEKRNDIPSQAAPPGRQRVRELSVRGQTAPEMHANVPYVPTAPSVTSDTGNDKEVTRARWSGQEAAVRVQGAPPETRANVPHVPTTPLVTSDTGNDEEVNRARRSGQETALRVQAAPVMQGKVVHVPEIPSVTSDMATDEEVTRTRQSVQESSVRVQAVQAVPPEKHQNLSLTPEASSAAPKMGNGQESADQADSGTRQHVQTPVIRVDTRNDSSIAAKRGADHARPTKLSDDHVTMRVEAELKAYLSKVNQKKKSWPNKVSDTKQNKAVSSKARQKRDSGEHSKGKCNAKKCKACQGSGGKHLLKHAQIVVPRQRSGTNTANLQVLNQNGGEMSELSHVPGEKRKLANQSSNLIRTKTLNPAANVCDGSPGKKRKTDGGLQTSVNGAGKPASRTALPMQNSDHGNDKGSVEAFSSEDVDMIEKQPLQADDDGWEPIDDDCKEGRGWEIDDETDAQKDAHTETNGAENLNLVSSDLEDDALWQENASEGGGEKVEATGSRRRDKFEDEDFLDLLGEEEAPWEQGAAPVEEDGNNSDGLDLSEILDRTESFTAIGGSQNREEAGHSAHNPPKWARMKSVPDKSAENTAIESIRSSRADTAVGQRSVSEESAKEAATETVCSSGEETGELKDSSERSVKTEQATVMIEQEKAQTDKQDGETEKHEKGTNAEPEQEDCFLLNLLDQANSEEDEDDCSDAGGGWLTDDKGIHEEGDADGGTTEVNNGTEVTVDDDGWISDRDDDGAEDAGDGEYDEEGWECSQGFTPEDKDVNVEQERHKVPTGHIGSDIKKIENKRTDLPKNSIHKTGWLSLENASIGIGSKSFYKNPKKKKAPPEKKPAQVKRTQMFNITPNAQHKRIQKHWSVHKQMSKTAVPLGRQSLVTGQKSKNQPPQGPVTDEGSEHGVLDAVEGPEDGRAAPTVKSSGYRSTRTKGFIESLRQAESQKDGNVVNLARIQRLREPSKQNPGGLVRSLSHSSTAGDTDRLEGNKSGMANDSTAGTNSHAKPAEPRRVRFNLTPQPSLQSKPPLFAQNHTSTVPREGPKEIPKPSGPQDRPAGLLGSWKTAFANIPDASTKRIAPPRRSSDVLSDILKASKETQKDLRHGRQRPCVKTLPFAAGTQTPIGSISETPSSRPADKSPEPPRQDGGKPSMEPSTNASRNPPVVTLNPSGSVPSAQSYSSSSLHPGSSGSNGSLSSSADPPLPLLERVRSVQDTCLGSLEMGPVKMTPSKALTVDQFLGWILGWKVNHMNEAVTGDPSKALSGCTYSTIHEVPNHFVSIDEFYALFLPLKMIQMWNETRRMYLKVRGEESPPAALVESALMMYEGKVYKKCCFKVSLTTSQDEPVPDTYPKKCDLVLIKPDNTDSFEPLLGYVDDTVLSTAAGFYSNRKSSDLSIYVRILGDANFTSHCVQLQPLMSLSSYIQQFLAFCMLPKCSVLTPSILSPTRRDVFSMNVDKPLDSAIYWEHYTREQEKFIQGAFNCIQESYGVPRICMLQGPPCSGKTRTLTTLVACLLRDSAMNPGQPTATKPKILLCTPNDNTMDVVLSHLWKILRRNKTAESRSHLPAGLPFFVLRLGDVNQVTPTYQLFVLDKLVNDMQAKCNTRIKELKTKIGELEMHEQSLDSKIQYNSNRNYNLISNFTTERLNVRQRRRGIEDQLDREVKWKTEFNQEAARSELLAQADVICCKISEISSPELQKALRRPAGDLLRVTFSCAIIDEACQILEVDTILPLYSTVTKLVMAGDPHELTHRTIRQVSRRSKLTQSLFTRLWMGFQGSLNRPVRMLTEQHMCHPEIFSFPNKVFYNNKIRNGSNAHSKEKDEFVLMPYLVFNLLDSEETETPDGDFHNEAEVELVQSIMGWIREQKLPKIAIAIISPYSEQIRLLKQRIKNQTGLYIGNLEGLQGKTKDIVIVSCVRTQKSSKNLGFLDNHNRINVAMTRASFSLFIVGNFNALPEINNLWGNLFRDAQQRELNINVLRAYIKKLAENCLKLKFLRYNELRQQRRDRSTLPSVAPDT